MVALFQVLGDEYVAILKEAGPTIRSSHSWN
jgi:hypothetical protein